MKKEINLCNVANELFAITSEEWNPITDSQYIKYSLLSGWHDVGTPRSPFAELIENESANELMDNYIMPRSGRSFFLTFESDSPEDREAAQKAALVFGDCLVAWLYNTSKKYAPIIKAFKDKETKLLDMIGTELETVSRFNDTPQDTTTPEDDDYLTTYGKDKTVSKSDGGSVMSRLAEIRDRFSDVYESWYNEFRRTFGLL